MWSLCNKKFTAKGIYVLVDHYLSIYGMYIFPCSTVSSFAILLPQFSNISVMQKTNEALYRYPF